MINKWKKYALMLLELPLIILGWVFIGLVALLTFVYIRWIRRGIYLGTKLSTWWECHELGYKIEKRK